MLRTADPRILVMAILTLLAVLFCIYKMVGALTGSDTSPAYQRTPPTAFAIPLANTLVNPQALNQPRLPDEAYDVLSKDTTTIGDEISAQTLTAEDLEAEGMSSYKASSALAQLKAYYSLYAGRKTHAQGFSLNGISTTSADISQLVTYGVGADGSPSGSFNVDYAFSYTDGRWILNSINADF